MLMKTRYDMSLVPILKKRRDSTGLAPHQHERYSCKTATCSKTAQVCYHPGPSSWSFRVVPMSDRSVRLQALKHALKERILILDGGMGTMIQSYKLEEQDYRGKRFADWPSDVKGNNDLLVLTRPDVIGCDREGLPGCRRRHSGNQHLQRHPGVPGRLRHGRAGVRTERRRRPPGTPAAPMPRPWKPRTSRVSSPACSARPAAPARCRRT